MGNEAPRTRTGQSVFETEDSTHGILCLVDITAVGTYATGIEDHTEHLLKKVELMGCQVVEIATACDIRLQAPGEILRMGIVKFARGNGKAYLNVDDGTDNTLFYDFFTRWK